jgi:hypothetical protein
MSVFALYQVLFLTTIKVGRLEWADRVVSVSDDRTVMNVLLETTDGRRKAGRPKLRWLYCSETVLKSTSVERWEKIIEDSSLSN